MSRLFRDFKIHVITYHWEDVIGSWWVNSESKKKMKRLLLRQQKLIKRSRYLHGDTVGASCAPKPHNKTFWLDTISWKFHIWPSRARHGWKLGDTVQNSFQAVGMYETRKSFLFRCGLSHHTSANIPKGERMKLKSPVFSSGPNLYTEGGPIMPYYV